MTDPLALTAAVLTDEQRAAFLAAIQADKTIGNTAALRQAGVEGTKGQLRSFIDDDLAEQAREARGWNIRAVENVDWEVALDKDHPSGDRARSRLLKAYGGQQFRDQATVEHTGQLEVSNPDVADAIDRFTAAVAAAAVRSAAGDPPELAAGDAPGPSPR